MQAAILNFAEMEDENKTLIIGDMFELGEQSTRTSTNCGFDCRKGFTDVF